MGDTFFRDRFPFIDRATGGSIAGMIAAAGAALAVMDASTMVIPGHGALSTREDLRAYRDALKSMRDAVAGLMEGGHPLEHIQDFRPRRGSTRWWPCGLSDCLPAGLEHAVDDRDVEIVLAADGLSRTAFRHGPSA